MFFLRIDEQMNTILTWCGYAVPLNEIKPDVLNTIQKELTLQPLSHPDYPKPASVKAYEYNSSKRHIRIPKYYGIAKFGPAKVDKQKSWKTERMIHASFAGTLRDNQIEPYQKTLTHLRDHKHGVLCLGTAYGKTVIAIAILCAIKQRTLILVHTINLIDQWKERIQQFAPHVKIGLFQGNKRPKPEDDVVIATFHSICKPENIRMEDRFGLVIIDECQFAPATTFGKCFYTVNAQYTLAISATPDRADGLEKLLYLHVGPIFYTKATEVQNHHLHVNFVHLNTPRKLGFHIAMQKPMHSMMITELSQDEARNMKIIQLIQDIGKIASRYILIFCERKEQAWLFHHHLSSLLPERTIGIKLGDTKRDQLQADIICTTYQSCGVGVEVPKINTAVFASPRTGRRIVEQAMSRVLRQPHSDGALLLDIVDGFLQTGAVKREKVYRARMGTHITITHTNPT